MHIPIYAHIMICFHIFLPLSSILPPLKSQLNFVLHSEHKQPSEPMSPLETDFDLNELLNCSTSCCLPMNCMLVIRSHEEDLELLILKSYEFYCNY